jgi:hypothetical protein
MHGAIVHGHSPRPQTSKTSPLHRMGRIVWYGMWREDVRTAEGKIVRRQHNVTLGTVSELPTKAAAQEALKCAPQIFPSGDKADFYDFVIGESLKKIVLGSH